MGTKAGGKRHSGEVDEGTRSSDAEKKEGKKKKKKMRRWLPKMFRSKRKYRSLSEECLHDTDGPTAATTTEPERNADVGMVVEESHEYGYQREVSVEENAENVIENVQKDDSPEEDIGKGEAESQDRSKDENTSGGKITSLGSALRLIKESFRSKKRRKHSADYTKFPEAAKSTDDLTTPANATTPSFSGTSTPPNTTDKTDSNVPAKNSASGKTRNKSTKYVRFTTSDCDGDGENNENKENITMTIDEKDVVEDVTSTTRKKKKSARKRAAKAGRTTGRVLGEGMLHMGKNLQYLSPIPTQHVFSTSSSSRRSTSGHRSGNTRPPKKRSYKYTASAPPTNPYAFI